MITENQFNKIDGNGVSVIIKDELQNEIIDVDAEDEIEDYEEEEDDDDDDDDEDDDDDDDGIEELDENINNISVPPSYTSSSGSLPGSVLIATDSEAIAKKHFREFHGHPVLETNHFTWEIKDWKSLKENKYTGPRFSCGGLEWNVLVFPHGNSSSYLALYLEPHPPSKLNKETDQEEPIDPDWYVCAQFVLDIWNPDHPEVHYPSYSSHRFSKQETDWGFSSFCDFGTLTSSFKNSKHALLENNKINITAHVQVLKDTTGVLMHNLINYDSKKNTGYVGINNQGATCYLNSLLQSYYHTKIFRKKVYEIPTENQDPNSSVPLALQRTFYQLQKSNDPVNTMGLTRSFGWDSNDAFTQHDVQELNRILMDKLETAMKGTPIEGCLSDIFVGKMKSYIKCVNVDFESSRVEDFWDIQLNVKNMLNLSESFRNYIEVEMLDGENKYQADNHGYQDAKKGVVFESFPPVLHLQLKRFEYDFMLDNLVKINDQHEFPDTIDLKPYLDEDSKGCNENWEYHLHGVLVHQGTISTGHYYALIKPTTEDQWFRFDDDKVLKVTKYEVFDQNFGADELANSQLAKMSRSDQNEYQARRTTSAYMLVYIRKNKLSEVLPNVTDEDIPSHIPLQIRDEQAEMERIRKEKEEMHLYSNTKIFTTESFQHFNGFDIGPDPRNSRLYNQDLFDPASNPLELRVLKSDKFSKFYDLVADKLKITRPFKLWNMTRRSNFTVRPDSIMEKTDEATIGEVCEKFFNNKRDEFCFFVQEANKDLLSVAKYINDSKIALQNQDPNDFNFRAVHNVINSAPYSTQTTSTLDNATSSIIIFLKFYDSANESLKGLTHAIVPQNSTISSLLPSLNRVLGLPGVPLALVEEVSYSTIEPVNIKDTFYHSELTSGDIICAQRTDIPKLNNYPSARSFYSYLSTRVHLVFRPVTNDFEDHVKPSEEEEAKDDGVVSSEQIFDLWVPTSYDYTDLAKEVGKKINVDPNYIRMFAVNFHGTKFPLLRDTMLSTIFPKPVSASHSTTFEYEKLSITLEEYENMSTVRVHWLSSGIIHFTTYDFLIPRNGTVADLIVKLQQKIGFELKDAQNVLLWSAIGHRFNELIRSEMEIGSVCNNKVDIFGGIYPQIVKFLKAIEGSGDIADGDMNEVYENYDDINILTVSQFYKNPQYLHGVPFIFVLHRNERFSETRKRLQEAVGLGQKEFNKVRITLIDQYNGVTYVEDDDAMLFDLVNESQFLALDHPDRSPRRISQDRGISIK